jgi:ABC-type uncharacterized transport system permease subunit
VATIPQRDLDREEASMLLMFMSGGLALLSGALAVRTAQKQPERSHFGVLRGAGYVFVVCGVIMLFIPLIVLIFMFLSF